MTRPSDRLSLQPAARLAAQAQAQTQAMSGHEAQRLPQQHQPHAQSVDPFAQLRGGTQPADGLLQCRGQARHLGGSRARRSRHRQHGASGELIITPLGGGGRARRAQQHPNQTRLQPQRLRLCRGGAAELPVERRVQPRVRLRRGGGGRRHRTLQIGTLR